MINSRPYASIAAIGDRILALINGHIDLAFRRIMPAGANASQTLSLDPRFIRLETGEPHPFGNFALMCDPVNEAGAGAAIDSLVRRNAPAAVLFVGAVSDSIVKQLSGAGFGRAGGLPAMAVDIDHQLAETSLPDGYTLARVTATADRDTWADTFARGYGLPLAVGAAFAGGIDGGVAADAAVQYFWILKNGKPVCTSLVYLENGVAGIYGVATLPEERKKGLGAHATEKPLRIARKLGYHVGVLQASMEGQPVYKRIGFADFGELPLFVRMPT